MAENQMRITVGGEVYTLTLDFSLLMGDQLEELEEHIGGEGVMAWARRLSIAMNRGVRMTDMRTRDILGLVFLARSQAEPGISWQDVARSTAPYAVQIADADDPPPVAYSAPVVPAPAQSVAQVLGPPPVAAPQGMPLSDVGGHTVPPPALVAPVVSPLVAAREAAQQTPPLAT